MAIFTLLEKLLWMSGFIQILGSINSIECSPVDTSVQRNKRSNLSDSIKEALKNVTERTTTTSTSTTPNYQTYNISTEVPVPIQLIQIQGVQEQQLQLQQGENIFSGLAHNVGHLNIGGIIMEAFKLAQTSIALFGHSLATQGGGTGTPIIVITNNTKLVGIN